MFTHLKLESWRNFLTVDVDLQQRTFLVGPNAAGKSNFLDVFKFSAGRRRSRSPSSRTWSWSVTIVASRT